MLETQIEIIIYLQAITDWLVTPMEFFSFLGTEDFYLFVAPALYWCVDRTLGYRFAIFLLASNSLNSLLKLVFHMPRPYWFDARVQPYGMESSFGIPSGHSQNAVVVWGMLGWSLSRQSIRWIAITLMFLIGFSRIILGLHFISDVLFGWLIGALLLISLLYVEKIVTPWIKLQSTQAIVILSGLVSLAVILLGIALKFSLSGWEIPAIWISNAAVYFPEVNTVEPISLIGLITAAGFFFGITIGAVWIERSGGFSNQAKPLILLIRFLVGIIGVLILWRGLGIIFPYGDNLLAYTMRYIRYALVGVWVSGFAPWLFVKLKLAVRN